MSSRKSGGPHLEFLGNEAGEAEGLGHAGIETFRDAPYSSLGREHGQNSLDARAADPVRVSVDLLEIAADDFPDHAAMIGAVQACLAQARDEKSKRFFGEAHRTLAATQLKILRVSDSNTKGLRGPAVAGTPFHALVKAAGVSEDKAETSGGSFGIGKNAAFAVSELQTVFYSTLYVDEGGTRRFLAQGKTILVSHTDANGKPRRATGYWGLDGFQPVEDVRDVPHWLARTEIGTSVFAVGFREKDNWAARVAGALLQNFFGAVHGRKLEFLIDDGRIAINAGTVDGLFGNAGIRAAAEEESRLEDLDCAAAMYRCLKDNDAVENELATPELGRTTVRVLMEDGLPKRVLLLRNGMWITDSLQHFGEKLQKFPMYRDFVAVVECHESTGNALLKQLESPRHDSLSAERIADPVQRRVATKIMRDLAKQIREAVRQCAKPEAGESVAIDELAEFFADTAPNDRPPAPGGEVNPEKLTYQAAKPRKKSPAAGAGRGVGISGGGGGDGGSRDGGKGGTGGLNGPGSGAGGTRGGTQAFPLLDPRNVLGSGGDARLRTLHFTPARSGTAELRIMATGIEDSEPLKIRAVAGTGALDGESVRMELKGGERCTLTLTLDSPYDGPIELVATERAPEVRHEA